MNRRCARRCKLKRRMVETITKTPGETRLLQVEGVVLASKHIAVIADATITTMLLRLTALMKAVGDDVGLVL